MAGVMSPITLIIQVLSDQGIVGSGYQIYTYQAGTTTPQTTYTSESLGVANSNPIVLGSNGRYQNVAVWCNPGTILKMVLTDNNNNVISGGTIDNIPCLNDFSSSSSLAAGSLDVTGDAQFGSAGSNTLTSWGTTAAAQVDISGDKGSWTTTLTGPYTSNPSGTLKWERQGNLVTIWCDASSGILGTSTSAATITASGLPAEITPSSNRNMMCEVEDGTVGGCAGFASVTTSNTIVFNTAKVSSNYLVPSNFASGETVGIIQNWSISYSL
jgi:hypothetical protein